MKKISRKLDNSAKAFSVGGKKHTNTFRLTASLKEKININFLKEAVNKTLKKYPSYKVKLKSGFFWNKLEFNTNKPVVEEDNKKFDLTKTNDYLFRVTYFNNMINLDACHILTDGLGAIILLKEILSNYLDLKYELKTNKNKIKNEINYIEDEHLKYVNKKLTYKNKNINSSFLIKDKSFLKFTKTNHFIINLSNLKNKCKKNNVSITEYLTAIYIYAIYNSLYDKTTNKDITLTVPIDLRRYYNVESFSNFFTSMNIESNIVNNPDISFDKLLKQISNEYKTKLTDDNIPKYLFRDVKLGTNPVVNLMPLFIKRFFMNNISKYIVKSTTSTFSNVGPIKLEDKYKKYINNIVAYANAGKIQRIKCTTCSYENNFIITINSNIENNKFEDEFSNLLKKYVGNFNLKNSIK